MKVMRETAKELGIEIETKKDAEMVEPVPETAALWSVAVVRVAAVMCASSYYMGPRRRGGGLSHPPWGWTR